VLVGLLVFVLGTGRERARRLVALRTGELHHVALHDALTGLPNRALIMDRLGRLLARCRREGRGVSAMFVDLDDFKNVNDTLGHHVPRQAVGRTFWF
jgi:GGDEF domain-containing protein